ncbi:hypothetical protein BN2476_650016 [Paraburkholderia piptadeniae]|uniref:Uncharacterized protein n=1 Tax=Paraburkholderia piptadeniae TaxID=1701573 RepID=A0A1N7SMY3_9BURK|nr:hypothetical protein BN2476_650016 [Paraburkholderia piptadeniae]
MTRQSVDASRTFTSFRAFFAFAFQSRVSRHVAFVCAMANVCVLSHNSIAFRFATHTHTCDSKPLVS